MKPIKTLPDQINSRNHHILIYLQKISSSFLPPQKNVQKLIFFARQKFLSSIFMINKNCFALENRIKTTKFISFIFCCVYTTNKVKNTFLLFIYSANISLIPPRKLFSSAQDFLNYFLETMRRKMLFTSFELFMGLVLHKRLVCDSDFEM